MKTICSLLIAVVLSVSCNDKKTENDVVESKVEFNQELATELERMAQIDQIAAYKPEGDYKHYTGQEWIVFKDSVFTTHQKRLSELFDTHGYVGYDLVGEAGSNNFWLMVQHSDHVPAFQEKVLKLMKVEVSNENADPRSYGLLVDRVKLNTGKPQVYGTQVTYNMNNGQAYPKKLADSATVNERRKSLGFESLEDYLNDMSQSHFLMNQQYYSEKGVTAPTFYATSSNEK